MRLNDWISEMEKIAPPELALDFDNPGLLISPETDEIQKVLIALDCSVEVAKEAAETGADLVLTHHPLFFSPVKHILKDDPETAAAWQLLTHGIGLYAAHTNLDAAEGGVNDMLLQCLRVRDIKKLQPEELGRIGTLESPVTLSAFAETVEKTLAARVLVSGDPDTTVRTVACVGGSGAEEMADAKRMGADVFLTGEMKHHEGLYAGVLGIPVIAAGHYETEKVVLRPLAERLQASSNDVIYRVALSDHGPFWHR